MVFSCASVVSLTPPLPPSPLPHSHVTCLSVWFLVNWPSEWAHPKTAFLPLLIFFLSTCKSPLFIKDITPLFVLCLDICLWSPPDPHHLVLDFIHRIFKNFFLSYNMFTLYVTIYVVIYVVIWVCSHLKLWDFTLKLFLAFILSM